MAYKFYYTYWCMRHICCGAYVEVSKQLAVVWVLYLLTLWVQGLNCDCQAWWSEPPPSHLTGSHAGV